MQFTVNLAAGRQQTQQTGGKFFLLLDTGAAGTVELWLMRGNEELEYIRTAARGFKARVGEVEGFTHILMRSSVIAQCEFVVSNGTVDFDFFAGANVQATVAGPLPLPVSNDRGSPGNLMYVAGVSVTDAPAVSVANGAAVAVTDVAAVVATANASTRSLRFTNIGTDPCAIGAAGITWAARCIVLNPGDTLVEDRAANLAWSAICATGLTASVTVQRVNA
jgi:hypothetical protein